MTTREMLLEFVAGWFYKTVLIFLCLFIAWALCFIGLTANQALFVSVVSGVFVSSLRILSLTLIK